MREINNARIAQRADGEYELLYVDEHGNEQIAGVDADPDNLDRVLADFRARLAEENANHGS